MKSNESTVRVQFLKLRNYRGVEKLDVNFTEQTTAFVGVNGVGKSTVLDAMAIALSQLTWRINRNAQKARPIAIDDIKIGADFARIEIGMRFGDELIQWAIVTNRKKGNYELAERKSDLDQLNEFTRSLIAANPVSGAEPVSGFPMVVFYDVNRAVLEVPMRVREKLSHTPYEVYQDALDHGGADFKRFFIWFRNFEDVENENRIERPGFREPGLQAARGAIETFTGFQDLRVRRKPLLRMTVKKDSHEFNVLQLSDGERNMLALVGDMARRLSVLNPHLPDPKLGSGVVLLDEIDLHLHPGWQRQIVANLEKTFPHCQFIISTHSPQVVGELRPESVLILRDGKTIGHPQVSYGLSSGHILEEVMEARARSAVVDNALAAVNRTIDHGALVEAREGIAKLRSSAPGIPELSGMEALVRRKEILGK